MKVADMWFGVEPAGPRLLRLREVHVDPRLAGNMWLVRGDRHSVLIDTGTGMVPLADTAGALAGGRIGAIACNHFYDHAGGLFEFEERLAHRSAEESLRAPTDDTSLSKDFVTDSMFSMLPRAGYACSEYAMRGEAPTRLLDDGDRIDLGDRQLEVLHVPGITPDSIALWDADSGDLFTSDLLYDGPNGRKPRPRDNDAFRRSLARIRELPVETVRPGHFASFGRERMLAVIDSYAFAT